MATLFKNFSPKPFGNANLQPMTNYGKVPSFTWHGLAPGTAPGVNLVNQVQPFGNPKAAILDKIPSIFKLLHG